MSANFKIACLKGNVQWRHFDITKGDRLDKFYYQLAQDKFQTITLNSMQDSVDVLFEGRGACVFAYDSGPDIGFTVNEHDGSDNFILGKGKSAGHVIENHTTGKLSIEIEIQEE